MHLRIFTFFICLLLGQLSIAGNQGDNKLYRKGQDALLNENYKQALECFSQLAEANEQNAEYHFLVGFSYYNLPGKKAESIPHFKTAIKQSEKDTISEVYYYLGLAQLHNEEFTAAKTSLTNFKKFIDKGTRQGQVLEQQVDDLIASTETAIEYINEPAAYLKVNNLGESVNSKYPDYAPVMSPESDYLLFTSRRKSTTGGKTTFDGHYYEDILIAEKNNNKWYLTDDKEPLDDLLHKFHNTKKHDAGVIYSNDGNTLYIYRKNVVWKSENKNGKWSDPEPVEMFEKNHKHVPSVALTPKGNTMFFVSRIESGLGGRDLYYTTLDENGKWSSPVNLGSHINTVKDEDAPFVSEDGKYLYFSSNGHSGVGGLDVYKAAIGDNMQIGEPENLGYPMNSPADDIFYIQLNGEEHGLISSNRKGTLGDMDIFEFKYDYPAVKTLVKGLAFNPVTKQPLANASITIKDETGKNTVATAKTDAKGKYSYEIMSDKSYEMAINGEGTETYNQKMAVPKITKTYESFQYVTINRLKNEEGADTAEVLLVKNSFADLAEQLDKASVKTSLPFINTDDKDMKRMALLEEYDFENNEDPYFAEMKDTVKYDIKTLAKMAVGQSFKRHFGYNEHQISEQEKNYKEWLINLNNVIKANGSVTVTIEASASKVPTRTFRTNRNLAKVRAKKARKLAEKDLKELGIDTKAVEWKENPLVQGPNYAGDFENKEKYGPFQYVNLTITQ